MAEGKAEHVACGAIHGAEVFLPESKLHTLLYKMWTHTETDKKCKAEFTLFY